MRVTACELVELDDGTAWLRIGDVMNLLKQELHVMVGQDAKVPAPAVTVRPTLVNAGDPFLAALDAKRVPAKDNGKGRVALAGQGDETAFRKLVKAGTAISKAARETGVPSNRAYYLAAKWKGEAEITEVEGAKPAAPARRCHECKQRTATDPCQHCGTKIAPGKAA